MKSDNSGRRAGFNLIELMVSMAVMSVGTAALFALQGYVARSNMTSKEMTIATSIAENWAERIKTDALNWTREGLPEDILSNTGYLLVINDFENTWKESPATYNDLFGHAPGSDLTGNEITPWPPTDDNITIGFCTHLKFNWVTIGSVMRVDIRVIWPRRPSGAVFATDFPFCVCDDGDGLDTDGNGVDDYHAVYTSTLVRWTPIPT